MVCAASTPVFFDLNNKGQLQIESLTEQPLWITRQRNCGVDINILQEASKGIVNSLQFNLFPDTILNGDITQIIIRTENTYTLIGNIVGSHSGGFIISVNEDVMVGNLCTLAGETYQILFTPSNFHIIKAIDNSRLPECGTGSEDYVLSQYTNYTEASSAAKAQTVSDDGSIFDVMVVYTAAARIAIGGTVAMEALINQHVDSANVSYANSGIAPRLRLVHQQEIVYTETGNSHTDIVRLQNDSDGHMDEVHVLRDMHGADMVHLLLNSLDWGGRGYQMTSLATDFSDWAFSLSMWNYGSSMAFVHELGHNMGCAHAVGDVGDSPTERGDGLYDYSHGWRFWGNSGTHFRTIMAYAPGQRISYFSNPNVSYDGKPTGNHDSEDNVLSINNAASTIANWRQIVSSPDYIEISGSSQINENSGAQYSCMAYYSDGSSMDVTNSTSWSENSAYASINSTGYLTTNSVSSDQSCRITATYDGKTDTHDITINNIAAILSYIEISGPTQVDENSSAQYTCTAYYSNSSNTDVTISTTWSENSAYASISAAGYLTTNAIPSDQICRITASYNGHTDTFNVTLSHVDTAPPTPDPMEWLTLPHATGRTSISMTAATAADDLNDVEYYFACTSGGGNDSGWQSSSTYEDTGLTPDTEHTYRVKARDTSPNLNTTGFSSEESATTDPPDLSAPTPDPMTWATPPESSGIYSVLMTADTASDPGGDDPNAVEYYFQCTAGGGNDSGWQDSNVYEDRELSENTLYTYQVKARDKSPSQNETEWSGEMSARTDIDFPAPGDINRDRVVDLLDLALFGQQFGQSGCGLDNFWCNFADIDLSTDVDAADLSNFAYNWLESFTFDLGFDTFDSYPDGTTVADLPDWYAEGSSSEVQSIGIGGSQGVTSDSTVFTWSAGDGSINRFNWSDLVAGDTVILSMDFEFLDAFEDDAVGWIIGHDSTDRRDYFRVRLDEIGFLGDRYGIEGNWDVAGAGSATVTIAEIPGTPTAGSWYRLWAEFTRLTATSVSIDAEVWLLDAAGAQVSKIAGGSIPDTSALGSDAPDTSFFTSDVWPAFRNDDSNDGACDNAYYGFMPTTH